jgi:hypothetical protein
MMSFLRSQRVIAPCTIFWPARLPVTQEAAGSSPVAPANSSTRTPLSSVKTVRGSITSALPTIRSGTRVLRR